MLKYAIVQGYLETYLANLGYSPVPVFDPGPDTDTVLQDQSPDRMVMIVVGSGAGLDSEEVFDRPIVHVRSIGKQNDYSDAEQLAQDVDNAMVALASSQFVGDQYVLTVTRTGGSPALLLRDDGDRYHFTCNYIWEVKY